MACVSPYECALYVASPLNDTHHQKLPRRHHQVGIPLPAEIDKVHGSTPECLPQETAEAASGFRHSFVDPRAFDAKSRTVTRLCFHYHMRHCRSEACMIARLEVYHLEKVSAPERLHPRNRRGSIWVPAFIRYTLRHRLPPLPSRQHTTLSPPSETAEAAPSGGLCVAVRTAPEEKGVNA